VFATYLPVKGSFQGHTGEYRVRFPGGTTFDQCACLYAQVRFVSQLWWVENQCESNKKIVKGTRIIAMIDREEIDNALKKIIHTIQEPVIGTFNGNSVDVTHEHALSK
jgi:hypothetical protein